MKRVFSLVIFLAFLGIFIPAFAVDFPKPIGFVNDFAGILISEERAILETILKDYKQQTSNEISIVIVPSFQGLDRFTYSQELFMKWGIGEKDRNNGILFLIGPSEGLPFPERGEVFINVGKGLEGAVPDSLAGSILRNEVFPEMRKKNFYQGVYKGVMALIQATKGEYKPVEREKYALSDNLFGFIVWAGIFLLSYVSSFLARSKSWWLGGVLGGLGGFIVGFIFFTGLIILIPAVILSLIGLIFDYAVSKNYAYRKAHGQPTDFWHSGGGFWFGGGGGFGGFGGGISGGGGAGGRW